MKFDHFLFTDDYQWYVHDSYICKPSCNLVSKFVTCFGTYLCRAAQLLYIVAHFWFEIPNR